MNYQHLMFDLDGTLIDSEAAIVNSCVATLEKFGKSSPKNSVFAEQVGVPISQILAPYIESNLISEACDYYRAHLIDNGMKLTKVKEGTQDILNFAFNSQIEVSIVTNKYSETAKTILIQLGIYKENIRIYGGDLGKPKPSDEILQLALREKFHNALMIGDRPEDILAAKAAKIDSAFVGKKFEKLLDIVQVEPNYKFENLNNLQKFLEKINQ